MIVNWSGSHAKVYRRPQLSGEDNNDYVEAVAAVELHTKLDLWPARVGILQRPCYRRALILFCSVLVGDGHSQPT